MGNVSDSKGGFAYDVEGEVLKVSGWGFWTEQICAQFALAILDEMQPLAAGRIVELSFADLKPLREAGQAALKRLFVLARQGVVLRIGIQVDSHLTKLQLKRLALDNGAGDLVLFH